jgi:hypothetical protein
MIPSQFHMERYRREEHKDHKGNDLLDYFQLHQAEGSAVSFKTHPIGGYLKTVLKKSDSPRQKDNENQRGSVGKEPCLL